MDKKAYPPDTLCLSALRVFAVGGRTTAKMRRTVRWQSFWWNLLELRIW